MNVLTKKKLLKKENVQQAYETLKSVVRHTPLQYDAYLSQKYNCRVYLKREDLQVVRSFKIRGAYYAIANLAEEKRKKVLFVQARAIMLKVLLGLVIR